MRTETKRVTDSATDPATLGSKEHRRWFLAARREWDDRYGGMAKNRRDWQRLSAALALLLLVSLGAIHQLIASRGVVPYVVEIDGTGEAVAVGPAEVAQRPSDAIVRHQLGRFVRNFRTQLADPEAQALLTADAYAVARGRARDLVRVYLERRRSERRGTRDRIRVEIAGVLPLSADTWQVQWSETRSGHQVIGERDRSLQAVLTVLWEPADDIEALNENPLGIYVTEIQWSETT